MKRFNYLAILGVLSFALLLPSCKKDKDVVLNQFELSGTTYELSKGFIENYGDNGNGSFDFDVTLTSPTINYDTSNDEFNGTGHLVYIDLNSSSSTDLVDGTYNYSTERGVFTFVDGVIAANADVSSQTGTTYGVTGGTVTISTEDTDKVFDFTLTLTNGTTVTGSFKGSLLPI